MVPNAFSSAPSGFQFIFAVVFVIIAVSFAIAAAKFLHNATSPVLQAHAKVIGKRTQVTGHAHMHGHGTHMHNTTRTKYFVTFELDNGERIELTANGNQYGLLVEGDIGMLTYQGEWYQEFVRESLSQGS